MNSPCQYQKTHIEKNMQNMDTDVRVLRVNELGNELKVLQSNQRQMNDQKQSSNSLTLIEQGMIMSCVIVYRLTTSAKMMSRYNWGHISGKRPNVLESASIFFFFSDCLI